MLSIIYEISMLHISGKAINLPPQSNLFILKSHKNHLDQNAQQVHYSENHMIMNLAIKFKIEIQEKHILIKSLFQNKNPLLKEMKKTSITVVVAEG